MIDLNDYRDQNGRIDLNKAASNGIIQIDKKPFKVGARPKIWCQCHGDYPDLMFKETLIDNFEDIAEIVGYELAKKLDLDCAEYDFAICDGKCGVITPDFIGNDEELINGGEILEIVSEEYITPVMNSIEAYRNIQDEDNIEKIIKIYNSCPVKSRKINELIKNRNNKNLKKELDDFFKEIALMYEYDFRTWNKKKSDYVSNNLFDIWSMLDNYCRLKGYQYEDNIMNNLIKMFFYDIILNQGDRHIKGNWAIILNHKSRKIRLAPLYDNSKICRLHNSKQSIEQKAQQIRIFEGMSRDENPRKYDAAAKQIDSISKQVQSKLMIDYDDVINNTDKFSMLEKLINISDESTFTMIRNLFNNIRNGEIVDIVDFIEKKYKISIPSSAKTVLIKTVSINVEKIEEIISRKERELYGQNRKRI